MSKQFNITELSGYPSLSAGQHSLTVKVTATGITDSLPSSPAITINKLAAPDADSISGTTLTIDEVEGADAYNVVASAGGTDIDLGDYAPLTMPSKGDLITMNVDGSDKQFRVLNVNGNNAEVVMMSNASDSQQFASSGRTYAGSALDTYLNSTWYATLNATAKAAIVDKTFTQDSWYWDASGNPDYSGYYGSTKPGTSSYTISLDSATFGAEITRHVYALSTQDVLDYILDTSITDGQLQNYNIWKMFWNDEVKHTGNAALFWLRSARASTPSNAFYVDGSDGLVYDYDADLPYAVRPAFQIDLTKITWSEVNS